jgi:DNA polymerase-3 subunit epsilon
VNQLSFEFDSTPVWAKRLAVFDTETTGLDLRESRIVTACLVELDEQGQIVSNRAEWLADPGIEIPTSASSVHGITTEVARAQGRAAKEVVAELLDAIRDCFARGVAVVAYNAPYDFTILHYEALRHGLEPLEEPWPVLDPLVIDKGLDTYRHGKRRLEVVAEHYGVQLSDAHNATADAIAAGRVMQAIAQRFAAKLPAELADMQQLQKNWAKAQAESFATFLRNNGKPEAVADQGWPIRQF